MSKLRDPISLGSCSLIDLAFHRKRLQTRYPLSTAELCPASFTHRERQLHVQIRNRSPNKRVVRTHIGLKNTLRRLELIYPHQHQLEIYRVDFVDVPFYHLVSQRLIIYDQEGGDSHRDIIRLTSYTSLPARSQVDADGDRSALTDEGCFSTQCGFGQLAYWGSPNWCI